MKEKMNAQALDDDALESITGGIVENAVDSNIAAASANFSANGLYNLVENQAGAGLSAARAASTILSNLVGDDSTIQPSRSIVNKGQSGQDMFVKD